LPLQPVVKDFKNFLQLMQDYKQHFAYLVYVPYLQYCLNVMGEAEDPLVLTGEAMNQEEFVKEAKKETDTSPLINLYHRLLALAVLFGDSEGAEAHFIATQSNDIPIQTAMTHISVNFLGALTYLNLSRTESRKQSLHRRKSRQLIKEVESWAKKGNMNFVDMLQLLKAEQLSTMKKASEESVRHAFDAAIQSSLRSGFMNHAALANERAGKYYLARNDKAKASDYLGRAVELYQDWGAFGKVHKMHWENEILTEVSQPLSSSGRHVMSVQSRERFTMKQANRHRQLSFDDQSCTSSKRSGASSKLSRERVATVDELMSVTSREFRSFDKASSSGGGVGIGATGGV